MRGHFKQNNFVKLNQKTRKPPTCLKIGSEDKKLAKGIDSSFFESQVY